MAEQFDIVARRHLDSAVLLEREGRLDDAGYHFGLVGENAVKYLIVTACGSLPKDFRQHFAMPLKDAIANSQQIVPLLMSGRRSVGLAQEIQNGSFRQRFDKWHIAIRYADTDYPTTQALITAWKADAVALIGCGVP